MKSEFEMRLLARKFRRENGLSEAEAVRLTSLLMKLNVQTFFKKLDDKISGISVKIDNNKFILINSEKSLGRQHFTICHELYHLFFEEDHESNICLAEPTGKRSSLEKKADLFASFLLLPEDGILELIPKEEMKPNKLTLMTLIKIEQYYSCSRGALLTALKRMKLINSNYYNRYIKDIISDARELGYDTTLYEKGNDGKIIGDYGEKAKRLFDSGKISEQNYISILLDAGIKEPNKGGNE